MQNPLGINGVPPKYPLVFEGSEISLHIILNRKSVVFGGSENKGGGSILEQYFMCDMVANIVPLPNKF